MAARVSKAAKVLKAHRFEVTVMQVGGNGVKIPFVVQGMQNAPGFDDVERLLEKQYNVAGSMYLIKGNITQDAIGGGTYTRYITWDANATYNIKPEEETRNEFWLGGVNGLGQVGSAGYFINTKDVQPYTYKFHKTRTGK